MAQKSTQQNAVRTMHILYFMAEGGAKWKRDVWGVGQSSIDERPFVEVLEGEGLTPPLRDSILYALALLTRGQDLADTRDPPPASAKEGLAALSRYFESLGRYGAGTGALMVPLYGTAELPQAFCRVAAVAGATYILNCPLHSVSLSEGDAHGSPDQAHSLGIKLSSGQELTCQALVGNVVSLAQVLPERSDLHSSSVARAVCIADAALREGESQVFMVIPPGQLPSSNPNPVYVLQVGEATNMAPKGRYLVYFWTLSRSELPEDDLQEAVETLLNVPPAWRQPTSVPAGERPHSTSGVAGHRDEPATSTSGTVSASGFQEAGEAGQCRPNALLAVYYRQATGFKGGTFRGGSVVCCGLPSGSVTYEDELSRTEDLFRQLYPDAPLFPPGLASEIPMMTKGLMRSL
eukprot:jgi/Botrbrau1/2961/Bobra.0026s0029.1